MSKLIVRQVVVLLLVWLAFQAWNRYWAGPPPWEACGMQQAEYEGLMEAARNVGTLKFRPLDEE